MSARLIKDIAEQHNLSGYWHTDFDLSICFILRVIEDTAKSKGIKLDPNTLYSTKWRIK